MAHSWSPSRSSHLFLVLSAATPTASARRLIVPPKKPSSYPIASRCTHHPLPRSHHPHLLLRRRLLRLHPQLLLRRRHRAVHRPPRGRPSPPVSIWLRCRGWSCLWSDGLRTSTRLDSDGGRVSSMACRAMTSHSRCQLCRLLVSRSQRIRLEHRSSFTSMSRPSHTSLGAPSSPRIHRLIRRCFRRRARPPLPTPLPRRLLLLA